MWAECRQCGLIVGLAMNSKNGEVKNSFRGAKLREEAVGSTYSSTLHKATLSEPSLAEGFPKVRPVRRTFILCLTGRLRLILAAKDSTDFC